VHGDEGSVVDGQRDAAAAWARELSDAITVVA
jgi:hypothetical protein